MHASRRIEFLGLMFSAISALGGLPALASSPVLYDNPTHQSPVRGEPDDLLMLAGYGLAATDIVVYQSISDTTLPLTPPAGLPGFATATDGVAELASVADVPYSLTVHLPAVMQSQQSYALWVRTQAGAWSNGVRINDARPLWVTPAFAYVTAQVASLPRQIKVVGRNLQHAPGALTQVRLDGPTTTTLTAADDGDPATAIEQYVAKVALPASLPAGNYTVEVSRDGTSWVPLADQQLEVLVDPTTPDVYHVSNYGCSADDGQDDTACIVNAINAAKASGGIVSFGPGTWNMINTPATAYDGVLVPVGVQLQGAGAAVTNVVRSATWVASRPTFTLQGNNRVQGFTFQDERIYESSDGGTDVGATLQLGVRYYRAFFYSPTDPTQTRNIVITENEFDKVYAGVSDGGLPMSRVFITYNRMNGYYRAITPTGNPGNTSYPFHIDDTVIAHNTFEPGSYIKLDYNNRNNDQGSIATALGGGRRLDFSDNFANGASTHYLYDPAVDPRGWRAAFFWNMSDNHERVLVSRNVATCTGDKAGDGEAIAYDGHRNTFALTSAQPALVATANSVTVQGPLQTTHNGSIPAPAGYYLQHWVQISQGPGMGQVRKVVSYGDNGTGTPTTFMVSPAWDVVPQSNSMITVARQYWQVYTIDNEVDERQPLCQKTNQTAPEAGLITLWAQTADSVVEGNRQYDADGINLQHQYHVTDSLGSVPGTTFQSFVEVRGNTIEGEYDWNSSCSRSGMQSWFAASPVAGSPPTVAGYGVSISHNTITHADGLNGGAIVLTPGWYTGPAPGNWKFDNNALIFNNHIANVSNTGATYGCGTNQARIGINLGARMAWRSVLYGNSCSNVTIPLQDSATSTIRYCPSGSASNCECSGAASTNLAISASANAATVAAGSTVTFTAVVTNHGPAAATGVMVTLEPTPGISIDSASYTMTGGTCDTSVNACARTASLASGASTTVTVTGTATASGIYPTAFAVTYKGSDSTASDNAAVVITTVP